MYNIFVYYNKETHFHLFKINGDVTLSYLKHQLDQINLYLKHNDTRRVFRINYHRSSIEKEEFIQFTYTCTFKTTS